MGEKFNSGEGGYICDHCRTLLWAGACGRLNPSRRRYIYSATPSSVVETKKAAFCSRMCRWRHFFRMRPRLGLKEGL